MSPDVNTSWFDFSADEEDFAVYAFVGTEEVNRIYEFSIELVSRSANVDIRPLLGTGACLSVSDRSGGVRYVHGLIRNMHYIRSGNSFYHYGCELVPRLWYLDKIRDHRIFQHLSVPDIISQILSEQGFTSDQFAFHLFYAYEPREYCVQYGESDFHFIARLCEEAGLFFYFEHEREQHKLCFSDREGGPPIPGESEIRFHLGTGSRPDTAVINSLEYGGQVNSNATAYNEWNFAKTNLDLYITDSANGQSAAPVPEGMCLEQYRYPHLYQLQEPGAKYAGIQLARQLTFRIRVDAKSDVSRILPGHTFSVFEHHRADVNRKWFTVRVRHEGKQPQVLEMEAPGTGTEYGSSFVAIPATTRFVPDLAHPKRRVEGQQTAIVTGPEGEEIFTDKYGRVKVQFFWDRQGMWDENTTRWIRVSQEWAGNGYGGLTIPRIGHEVIVSYEEGDPDKPIVSGCVHHERNRYPYDLPEHKTRSTFKSMSTPGEEGEEREFNELRIEDKKSVEEIYGHAAKDMDIHVKNDWKDTIVHDRHRTIEANSYSHVHRDDHQNVGQKRKTELHAEDHLTVRADSHISVGSKLLEKAGQEFHFEAAQKMIFEGKSEVLLKIGGGAYIKVTAGGIEFSRTAMNLNGGGSAGTGSGAQPLLPEGAEVPLVPQGPPKPECLCKASAQRSAFCTGE